MILEVIPDLPFCILVPEQVANVLLTTIVLLTYMDISLFISSFPASLEFDNPTYYIDAPDFEENTALHLACHKGYREIAELLLSQGAEVVDGETDFADRHTPLHLAAAYGHVDVVELLISYGAPVDCRDELQRTPLQR